MYYTCVNIHNYYVLYSTIINATERTKYTTTWSGA